MGSTGIYKITSPSNKIYIGQSIEIEKRWKRDYYSLNCKSQTKLYNSFKKYGVENHKFEIIERNKGINKSSETKLKMSQAVKNRKYTSQRLERMKNSMMGKNTKTIICITTNKTFSSIREAASKLSLNERAISNNLCGLSNSLKGGYKFKYV